MTGGDPNLSFLGRWQIEQRCRNRFSPRFASALGVVVPGITAEGLPCARNTESPLKQLEAKIRSEIMPNLVFKVSCNLRKSSESHYDYNL